MPPSVRGILAVLACLVGAVAVIPAATHASRSAIADAHENLAGRSHDIVRGEVGGWRKAAGVDVDVVIADPARSGLGAPGVAALARAEAPVLALVSCDPASLGRDAGLLRAHGLQFSHALVRLG